jgi:uncharacterized membrane protein
MTEGATPREPGEEERRDPGGGSGPPPPPPAGGGGWGPSGGRRGWGSPGGGRGGPGGPGWGPPGGPRQPGTTGLPENTACGLAYVATFVTGAIFFVLDRRPEVRFHAMQAILFGVAWLVVWVLRQAIHFFPLDFVLYLAWIAGLVIWVVLLVRGFQGNHFKLPFIGDLAEQQARRTP